jgi:hypothetical protein
MLTTRRRGRSATASAVKHRSSLGCMQLQRPAPRSNDCAHDSKAGDTSRGGCHTEQKAARAQFRGRFVRDSAFRPAPCIHTDCRRARARAREPLRGCSGSWSLASAAKSRSGEILTGEWHPPRSASLSSRRPRFLFGSFLSSAMSRARSIISAICCREFWTPSTSASRSNFYLNLRSAVKRKLYCCGRAGSRMVGDTRTAGRGLVAPWATVTRGGVSPSFESCF